MRNLVLNYQVFDPVKRKNYYTISDTAEFSFCRKPRFLKCHCVYKKDNIH